MATTASLQALMCSVSVKDGRNYSLRQIFEEIRIVWQALVVRRVAHAGDHDQAQKNRLGVSRPFFRRSSLQPPQTSAYSSGTSAIPFA